MDHRMLSLLLAGTLTFTALTACGGGGTETAPPPETTLPVVETVPAPETSPLPEATPAPETAPVSETAPVPETAPPSEPAPTPKPTAKPTPAPTPTPAPVPTPTPGTSQVQAIWDQIAADLKDVLPASSDLTGEDLQSVYGIDPADLKEFICKTPLMTASITEFFVAEVKEGKLDAVKAACEARQEALAGGFLYPSMVELVEDYRLVTGGNYILFCITENADKAVEIFNSFTK